MISLTEVFSDYIPKEIAPESRIRQFHGACRAIRDQLAGARSDNRIRKLRNRLERNRREGLRLELEQRGPVSNGAATSKIHSGASAKQAS